jgi:hypothetical protein
MPTISLATYTVRVVDRSGNPVPDLTRWPAGSSFDKVVANYLGKRHLRLVNNPARKSALRVVHFVTLVGSKRRSTYVSGTLERGGYGFSSTIFNVPLGKASYARQPTEANLIPYYFLFEVCPGADEGIFILERFGRGGIKSALGSDLAGYIRDKFPGFSLKIRTLVPSQLFDRYLEDGRIVRVRLIRFGIPRDIADRYAMGHDETEGKVEFSITAERGREFPLVDRIKGVLTGGLEPSQFLVIDQLKHYNDVKVELNLRGSRKTINLGHPSLSWPTMDVTDQVEPEENGHPKFESIDEIARSYAMDIRESIGPA